MRASAQCAREAVSGGAQRFLLVRMLVPPPRATSIAPPKTHHVTSALAGLAVAGAAVAALSPEEAGALADVAMRVAGRDTESPPGGRIVGTRMSWAATLTVTVPVAQSVESMLEHA